MSVGEGEVGEREEAKGERKARETCDKEERVVTNWNIRPWIMGCFRIRSAI
jgi:hypothetical protein